MKIEKTLMILIFLFSFLSCVEKREIIKDNELNKLSDGNYLIPSKNGGLDLYVLSENEEIIITNADYLNFVYDKQYKIKYKNFKEFLSDALNHKIIIKAKCFERIPYKHFSVNKFLEVQYNELGFNNFFERYTKNTSDKDSFILNLKIDNSLDEIETISYYFYLNGYQVIIDDHIPKYFVFKRDKVLK
jgi:hypothetical protein